MDHAAWCRSTKTHPVLLKFSSFDFKVQNCSQLQVLNRLSRRLLLVRALIERFRCRSPHTQQQLRRKQRSRHLWSCRGAVQKPEGSPQICATFLTCLLCWCYFYELAQPFIQPNYKSQNGQLFMCRIASPGHKNKSQHHLVDWESPSLVCNELVNAWVEFCLSVFHSKVEKCHLK